MSYSFANQTKYLNFTTPKLSSSINGSLIVKPLNGTAFNTFFRVKIVNWISEYEPIKYRVFGMFDDHPDDNTHYLLSDEYYY